MNRYRTSARVVFGVVFLGGALAHAYFASFSPQSYAPFADTALWLWLADLWRGSVMANIEWLSLVTAAFELVLGAALLAGGRAARLAALAALGFFAFILVLGYSWPAQDPWEDFLKNRAATVLLASAIAPVLRAPDGSGPTKGRPSRTV